MSGMDSLEQGHQEDMKVMTSPFPAYCSSRIGLPPVNSRVKGAAFAPTWSSGLLSSLHPETNATRRKTEPSLLSPKNLPEDFDGSKRGMTFVGADLAAKFIPNRVVIAAKAAPPDENRTGRLSWLKKLIEFMLQQFGRNCA